jgi:glucose-1-phosphate cytidylyltransferase
MCTYGDSVGNVDIPALLKFHQSHGKIATVTGVHPMPRFGELSREGDKIISYSEKPQSNNLVNGGFFVFNRNIFDYLSEDENCDLETGVLEKVAADGELMMYHHKGFWRCMDTMKDLGDLQALWDSGKADWRIW